MTLHLGQCPAAPAVPMPLQSAKRNRSQRAGSQLQCREARGCECMAPWRTKRLASSTLPPRASTRAKPSSSAETVDAVSTMTASCAISKAAIHLRIMPTSVERITHTSPSMSLFDEVRLYATPSLLSDEIQPFSRSDSGATAFLTSLTAIPSTDGAVCRRLLCLRLDRPVRHGGEGRGLGMHCPLAPTLLWRTPEAGRRHRLPRLFAQKNLGAPRPPPATPVASAPRPRRHNGRKPAREGADIKVPEPMITIREEERNEKVTRVSSRGRVERRRRQAVQS
mmetsp:Transcript_16949/g.49380  ORF Transcript_16949/g.49380 Transcript_16949/m.49380 type:complete len:280 (+) Transcript_16949:252-1091(+)